MQKKEEFCLFVRCMIDDSFGNNIIQTEQIKISKHALNDFIIQNEPANLRFLFQIDTIPKEGIISGHYHFLSDIKGEFDENQFFQTKYSIDQNGIFREILSNSKVDYPEFEMKNNESSFNKKRKFEPILDSFEIRKKMQLDNNKEKIIQKNPCHSFDIFNQDLKASNNDKSIYWIEKLEIRLNFQKMLARFEPKVLLYFE